MSQEEQDLRVKCHIHDLEIPRRFEFWQEHFPLKKVFLEVFRAWIERKKEKQEARQKTERPMKKNSFVEWKNHWYDELDEDGFTNPWAAHDAGMMPMGWWWNNMQKRPPLIEAPNGMSLNEEEIQNIIF